MKISLQQTESPPRRGASGTGSIAEVGGVVDSAAGARSAYLHVPFCFHKCHYCDFYSIVDNRDRQEAFAARLAGEIAAWAPLLRSPLRTIFVGGGTPTLLTVAQWRTILAALAAWPIDPQCEFTVEANPETVTADLAETLTAGGVTRVSIGAQSFNPIHLKTLERWHEPASVARAVGLLRSAGIDNLNLDLIFAIPGQTLDEWADDLRRALDLGPEHLSCYGLTFEPRTALTARRDAGEIAPADEDLEAEMFDLTREMLSAAGLLLYEISNFARSGRECRHNLAYWRDEKWIALGPSASGHLDGLRWRNAAHLQQYLDSAAFPPLEEIDRADPATQLADRLMMGLRLAEGLERGLMLAAAEAIGRGAALERAIVAQEAAGLIDADVDRLRLTEAGLRLTNAVVSDLGAALRG